ncbi:MAG: polysaccharide biosynthesis/export family protein [Lentisphaeria bacterium]|nr:polysaccharide biosynthesis/export family protein [Lentisphaeria bacterium]
MRNKNSAFVLLAARIFRVAMVVSAIGFLWGQDTRPENSESARAAAPVIKPGVVLEIEVLASGDIEVPASDKRVSDGGTISLPLVGDVKVENLTIDQLQEDLTRRYLKYLRKPQVLVGFNLNDDTDGISPFGHVTVLGRVKKPGWIKIPPTRNLTVARAIQQAGGFDTSAKASSIKVTRQNKQNETESFTVDLKAIGSKGDLKGDLILQAGDVIYVPEQIW